MTESLLNWGHDSCPEVAGGMVTLANVMTGEAPVRVFVSTDPPAPDFPHETFGWPCPHGITYWIRPTDEQVAEWEAAEAETEPS